MKKISISATLFIAFIFLILGYAWRMHHEYKNLHNTKKMMITEFLYALEKETNIIFYVEDWQFIKRADGSIVMKKL